MCAEHAGLEGLVLPSLLLFVPDERGASLCAAVGSGLLSDLILTDPLQIRAGATMIARPSR